VRPIRGAPTPGRLATTRRLDGAIGIVRATDPRPETRYVCTPEEAVAYQELGDGPRDLLFIQNWGSNIEVM
jgi:hypothetical protein